MVNFGKKSVLLSVLLASVSIVYVEAGKNGELRGRSFSQEEATTIIDVTSPKSETPTMEETAMNAAQEGERALNGRAKAMKAMVTETTFEAPSTEVMDNFMTEHHMMKGVSLPMQKISKRNTIKVNGAVHSLEGLIPMDVFSDDATYMFEGKAKARPTAATFMKVESDSTMLVTKGPGGNVETVDITYTDGSNIQMHEISDGVLAIMLPEALDKKAMKQFVLAHADPSKDGSNGNESRTLMARGADSSVMDERNLQSGCGSLRVIDLAIAYDSSFCREAGGANNANAIAQQIVARASSIYQSNLCTKIQITHMEGFCDPSTDPYRAGTASRQSGCSGDGLLRWFTNYFNTNRSSVNRDTAHLFTGTSFESRIVGCAWTRNLCNSNSYAIHNFASRDLQSQTVSFAHELGHNAGYDHDPFTSNVEWIMEPTVNSGANGFSPQSRSAIGNYLAGSSCISVEQSQPLIPNWSTCTSGSSTCANNWVCCVAPADVSSGKATCRPNQSATYCASSSTVPNWNNCRRNVDTCSGGYTCCVAPADVSSGKTTCRPTSGGWCAS